MGIPLAPEAAINHLKKCYTLIRTQILLPWTEISLVLCSCCYHLWQCKGLRLTKPHADWSFSQTLCSTHSRSQQCKKLDVLFSMPQGQDYSSLEDMHLAPQIPKILVMLLLQLPEQAFKNLIDLTIAIFSLMSPLHSLHAKSLLVFLCLCFSTIIWQ